MQMSAIKMTDYASSNLNSTVRKKELSETSNKKVFQHYEKLFFLGWGEGSNKFFCYIDKSITLGIFEDTQKWR